MVIYLVYQDNTVICVTTLPRIVQDQFKSKVELWRNDKLIKTFTRLREFNKYINPRPSEDDDTGGQAYEW